MSYEIFIDTEPTVLVDMDGVIADFDMEVKLRLQDRHPEILIKETRKNFYISDDYPEHSLLVRSISDEQGFFETLPLVEHALEGWQRIIDLGYHPIICSSPLGTNPYSKFEKINWLKQHFAPIFGQWVIDQAIITSDKHLFKGVALIDDRPVMKNSDLATWKHILFDQEYNRSDTDHARLRGWLDDALPELLEVASKNTGKSN
ncbi:MAG TPA: hypothetical protein VMV24_01015 [Candidatus Dormibacteraeota bacterium]|nr:hypothetical protein [Candidatus Dormibacteraeota bacterium]